MAARALEGRARDFGHSPRLRAAESRSILSSRPDFWKIVAPFGLLASSAVAGQLGRNGDPSDHPIVWYTQMGMAMRDVVREMTGRCYPHVGEIVVCGRRDVGKIRRDRGWPPHPVADSPAK